jgi:hypothetical protein
MIEAQFSGVHSPAVRYGEHLQSADYLDINIMHALIPGILVAYS